MSFYMPHFTLVRIGEFCGHVKIRIFFHVLLFNEVIINAVVSGGGGAKVLEAGTNDQLSEYYKDAGSGVLLQC